MAVAYKNAVLDHKEFEQALKYINQNLGDYRHLPGIKSPAVSRI
jgi:hypothetical protein